MIPGTGSRSTPENNTPCLFPRPKFHRRIRLTPNPRIVTMKLNPPLRKTGKTSLLLLNNLK